MGRGEGRGGRRTLVSKRAGKEMERRLSRLSSNAMSSYDFTRCTFEISPSVSSDCRGDA